MQASKIQSVENYVRSRVSDGHWDRGSRIPPESDLADHLNVGIQTVKSALSRLAEDGFLERRQRKGTFISHETSVACIGILMQSRFLNANSGILKTIGSLVSRIESSNKQAVLITDNVYHADSPETWPAFVQSLVARHLVGLVSVIPTGPLEKFLARKGIPSVSIIYTDIASSHNVVYDYVSMAQMAREYFKSRGFDNFTVMHYDIKANDSIHRRVYEAIKLCVDDDMRRTVSFRQVGSSSLGPYEFFKQYWLAGNRPKAIFCFDDILFDSISRAILELGIKVPGELAIMTHGNIGNIYQFPCPVTALEFDPDEAAMAAMNMIDEKNSNRKIENKTIFLKPRLRLGLSA